MEQLKELATRNMTLTLTNLYRCPLHSKGLAAPLSLPAAQASVFSSSGCVTDGATALTERMKRLVETPPILHSVSLPVR